MNISQNRLFIFNDSCGNHFYKVERNMSGRIDKNGLCKALELSGDKFYYAIVHIYAVYSS